MSDSPDEEEKAGPEIGAMKEVLEMKSRLEEAEKKNGELATSLKYLQSDFENYRRRTDKETKDIEDVVKSRVVAKLLTVLDELELAIKNVEAGGDAAALLDGIKMVYGSLSSTLEKEGLQVIESVGKPFDPRLHEAVESLPGDGEGEVVVAEEVRKGFMFKNQVLRPSMVKVKLVSSSAHVSEVGLDE